MRNFIESADDKTVTIPTVQEAERILESLIGQLKTAEDLERELNASSEPLALRAFDGDSTAKNQLERLDKDLNPVSTKKKMLRAGIKRGESNLAQAKVIEADRIALEQAEKAREIVSELPPLGIKMAEAISAFLDFHDQYQETEKRLAATGYPAFPHLESQISGCLATILQRAQFSHLDMHHGFHPGQTFETLFRDLEQVIRQKNANVIGDVVSPAKVEVTPVASPLPDPSEPVLAWEKSDKVLDQWNAMRAGQ
jgi:hypothetical protein